MQPERIQGAQYTVKSDVWSLWISLIELALGRFPFSQSESDDESDSDFEGTLSPAPMGALSLNDLPVVSEEGDEQRPLPPPRRRPKKTETTKKDKRRSKGVSLQGGGMTMSILELLQHIVNEPAPRLTPEGRYPKEAELFIDACLMKKPEERMTPKDLLVSNSWVYIESALTVSRNMHGLKCRGCPTWTWRPGQTHSENELIIYFCILELRKQQMSTKDMGGVVIRRL